MTQEVVIDASIWLAYVLPDESVSHEVEKIFDKFLDNQLTVIAPPLLKIEFANGLSSAVKSERLLAWGADELFDFFLQYQIEYRDVEIAKALQLSTDYNLSVYDAMYLSLSRDFSAELITNDKKLLAFTR